MTALLPAGDQVGPLRARLERGDWAALVEPAGEGLLALALMMDPTWWRAAWCACLAELLGEAPAPAPAAPPVLPALVAPAPVLPGPANTVAPAPAPASRGRDRVLLAMPERGEMACAAIITATGLVAHSTHALLSTMAREGLVEAVKRGVYRLTPAGRRERAALAQGAAA